MGFPSTSRRVGDLTAPVGRRLAALRSLIGRYGPLGYQATWRYLEQVTGLDRQDPQILAPALDLLSTEHALRVQAREVQQTKVRRHRWSGHRLPPGGVTAERPRRWYGDESRAARVLLETQLGSIGPEVSDEPRALVVLAAAAELAAGAPTTSVDLATLQQSLHWARVGDSYLQRRIEELLAQVVIAQWGALELGERWQVVPDRREIGRWLRPGYAAWRTDPRAGRELVLAAARLVAHGAMGAALASLSQQAGRPDDSLVDQVLVECGLTAWQQVSSQRWALELRAREGVAGRVEWREIADWAASTIGPHGDLQTQGFVALAERYRDPTAETRRLDHWAEWEATRLLIGAKRDPHGPPVPPVIHDPPRQTWRPPSRTEQAAQVIAGVLKYLEQRRNPPRD